MDLLHSKSPEGYRPRGARATPPTPRSPLHCSRGGRPSALATFDSFLADLERVLGGPQPGPSPPPPAAGISPATQVPGAGDEPTTLSQGAAVAPASGDGAASPFAGGTVDAPRASKTPAPPAGQPTAAVGAPTRREAEVDPAPPPGGEERSAGMAPPSGLSRPTGAAHPALLDAVPAGQARSSALGLKKTGRWWLGMALVASVVSAVGYAYLGPQPTPEPTPMSQKAAPMPDVAATPAAGAGLKPADFTVYVQYPEGRVDTAEKAQSFLLSLGYRVPGIQQASKTPSRIQVRYYRQNQKVFAGDLATQLGQALSLPASDDNAILVMSSNELPSNTLEVWLPP